MLKNILKITGFLFLSFGVLSSTFAQDEIKNKNAIEFVSDYNKHAAESILIDVRTPQEYAEGSLENARNINFFDDDFVQQIQYAVTDKNQRIYLYYKSGNRSGKAARKLKEAGYTNIINATVGYDKLKK